MSWELCWSRQAQLNLKSFCFLISYIFPAVNLGWLFIRIHCLISKILWRESPAPVFREVKLLGFCNNTVFIWLFVCFSCLCGTEQSTPTIKRCWSKFRSWRWRRESWEKPCFVTVMERGRAILCWCFKKKITILPCLFLIHHSNLIAARVRRLLSYIIQLLLFCFIFALHQSQPFQFQFSCVTARGLHLETAAQSLAWWCVVLLPGHWARLVS